MILAGLCLLAFGLRVARLDFHPIWFDEDLAYQRATAAIEMSLASMAGSPLYYILLRGWVELAGTSLFAMRFFSAFFGTLAIPLIFQLIRCLPGNRIALTTTALTAFAPFYIYYSQEARTYAFTLALTLISNDGWVVGYAQPVSTIYQCVMLHYIGGTRIMLSCIARMEFILSCLQREKTCRPSRWFQVVPVSRLE